MARRRKKTFRMRFTFWLDKLRQDESELITYVEELKAQRKFATTVKEGLRLIRDLRAGNTTVLFELFPGLKSSLQPDNSELVTLITSMMHSSPTPAAGTFIAPKMPTFDTVPVVGHADESKARELSIQNALASLDDF